MVRFMFMCVSAIAFAVNYDFHSIGTEYEIHSNKNCKPCKVYIPTTNTHEHANTHKLGAKERKREREVEGK